MAHRLRYGGQAVMEGVMMRGPRAISIAVRRPDQEITVKTEPFISWTRRVRLLGLPVVRGVVVLIESLALGIGALVYSANESAESQEEKLSPLDTVLSVGLAVGLAVLLFVISPTLLTGLLGRHLSGVFFLNLAEGGVRIGFLLGYIIFISRMKEIERVLQYHGAEHKVIHAHEAGEELTVASVRKYPVLHPRCGTSFLLFVAVVSVFLFAFFGWPGLWQRVVIRVLTAPVLAGLAYEAIRLSGSSTTWLVRILVWPGLLLQRLTTREPDDSQLEVAIKALEGVLEN